MIHCSKFPKAIDARRMCLEVLSDVMTPGRVARCLLAAALEDLLHTLARRLSKFRGSKKCHFFVLPKKNQKFCEGLWHTLVLRLSKFRSKIDPKSCKISKIKQNQAKSVIFITFWSILMTFHDFLINFDDFSWLFDQLWWLSMTFWLILMTFHYCLINFDDLSWLVD